MAVTFALCCLCFTAVNDLVFKFYARKSRTRGLYVMIIGIIWMVLYLLAMRFDWRHWQFTLMWGLISGLFSVTANVLLIEAMAYHEAGVCATIYRLNLVAVVVGAILLLGETVNLTKLLGVAFAVIAVLLFARSEEGGKLPCPRRQLGMTLILVAALMRAGMGLSYKYALVNGADCNGLVWINSFCWIGGGLLYTLWREPETQIFNRTLWLYGLSSGILVSGIVFFMAAALRYGDAGAVLPIAQMSFLVTAFLGAVILRETLGRRKIMGIAAGLLCILLLGIC